MQSYHSGSLKSVLSFLLCISFLGVLLLETAQSADPYRGVYHVYAQPDTVEDYAGDINDIGYYPEQNAAGAGYQYFGQAIDTAEFEFPESMKHLLIFSPSGSAVRLDAITFIEGTDNIIGWINYYKSGMACGYWVAAGLADNNFMVQGIPDGFYSLVGWKDLIRGYYHAKAVNVDTIVTPEGVFHNSVPTTFTKVRIHIAEKSGFDVVYNGNAPQITSDDKQELHSILNDLATGYSTKNKELILPYYPEHAQSKVSSELDLIFANFDTVINYGNRSYTGRLPYGWAEIDNASYILKFHDVSNQGVVWEYTNDYQPQTIFFSRSSGQWKMLYDQGGPHIYALQSLSRIDLYTFPTTSAGDINGDETVSLKDVLLSLQIMAAKTVTGGVVLTGDIDGDGKIGLSNAVYVMNKLAGF